MPRWADPEIDLEKGTRRCTSCGRIRDFSLFYKYKNKRYSRCKCCVTKELGRDKKFWVIDGTKWCIRCRQFRNESRFRLMSSGKPRRVCLFCEGVQRRKNFARAKEHLKQKGVSKYSLAPERNRRNSILKKYGLTHETYMEMYESQKGVCFICEKPQEAIRWQEKGNQKQYLAVDHDHKTGAVRKLLCNRCNFVIGAIEKNPSLVDKFISYIQGNL